MSGERIRQKKMIQEQLITELEYMTEACSLLISRLKEDSPCSMGGALQSMWHVFYRLGELNILSADYLFEEKK
jgi:hypothetical protein